MKEKIEKLIKEASGIDNFSVEHPSDSRMGDYSTNAGIKTGKAKEILEYLNAHKPEFIEKIELAGPGFINFYLSKEFFQKSLGEIINKGNNFGKSEHAKGFRVMVEHTDPNPFKEFHIGHLMPNVIGSTIARIFEWNGAEVKQANYQGDVGLHVAKSIWESMNQGQIRITDIHHSAKAYVVGSEMYETDIQIKKEIDDINRKIYDRSDPKINELYDSGRESSLKYFESIYKKLNSKFDFYFFESETAPIGKKIVEENIGKVFEESDGAIVFKGEKFDPSLHTRVFINSQGIPTYEAKDLGNAKNKSDVYPYDLSVVVTGNEIKEYFRVMLAALGQIYPELAKKTKHLPHGMLRLPSGKMSSRTGEVITAEELIEEVKTRTKGDEQVAIAAIKYMILRQAIGNDIVFDFEKSVSTEGDSGVYLQYAHARANSILEKAKDLTQPSPSPRRGQEKSMLFSSAGEVRPIERLLYRFPEIVERAGAEYAPNYITTYLTELAASFNNFYAHEQVISGDAASGYRLAIVEAFKIVMKNGLNILGIAAPERM